MLTLPDGDTCDIHNCAHVPCIHTHTKHIESQHAHRHVDMQTYIFKSVLGSNSLGTSSVVGRDGYTEAMQAWAFPHVGYSPPYGERRVGT